MHNLALVLWCAMLQHMLNHMPNFVGKTSYIMRNVKVANLYSLLTGLPVGRVEGGKVLSARFVFRFILTGMKT